MSATVGEIATNAEKAPDISAEATTRPEHLRQMNTLGRRPVDMARSPRA